MVPFPLVELQARWVARALSGARPLPPPDVRAASAAAAAARLAPAGGPIAERHAHRMEGGEQFTYMQHLAELAGCAAPPAWRQALYEITGSTKRLAPGQYREMLEDNESADPRWAAALAAAAAEFQAVGDVARSAADPGSARAKQDAM